MNLDDLMLTPPASPTVSDMSPDTAKRLRHAAEKAHEWTAKRDELIRRAVDEGGSLRTVGDVAGVSHQTVKNVCRGRRDR